MTPDDLAKTGTEHAHQRALFAWIALARLHGLDAADRWAETGVYPPPPEAPALPYLALAYAIPNGGKRDQITAGKLKAEGVKSGAPDICIPVPFCVNGAAVRCGLYIEMKKPALKPKKPGAKGGRSDEQIEFAAGLTQMWYAVVTCYSWREAADALKNYLRNGTP